MGSLKLTTTGELKSLTRDRLAEMARELEIEGRGSMNKQQLIQAVGTANAKKAPSAKPSGPSKGKTGQTPKSDASKADASKAVATKTGAMKAGKGRGPKPEADSAKPSGPSKPRGNAPAKSASKPAAKSAPRGKPAATSPKSGSAKSTSSKAARGARTPSGRGGEAANSPAAAATKGTTQAQRDRKSRAPASAASKSAPSAKTAKQASTGRVDRGAATGKGTKTAGKSAGKRSATQKKAVQLAPAAPPVSAKSKRIREEMRRRSLQAMQNKDLSTGILVAGLAIRGGTGQSETSPHKDRISLVVRDSYWLQADWEITRAAVDRVRVAMSEKWHKAQPVLRLMAVGDAGSNRAEQLIRDIPIHGGVTNWYIDVDQPPSRFRVVIGYLAENERFYPLCRSNIVSTPKPDAVNRLDRHWRDIAEDYERIYSLSGGYDATGGNELKELFEERLQRPMPSRPDDNSSSDTDAALDRHRALPFEVDAELIVFGSTTPGATVLLSGEPVKLRDDGTFTVRVALPDKRQVLPVIAQSRDSMKQRTTVIAVERNTKVMEAVDRDQAF